MLAFPCNRAFFIVQKLNTYHEEARNARLRRASFGKSDGAIESFKELTLVGPKDQTTSLCSLTRKVIRVLVARVLLAAGQALIPLPEGNEFDGNHFELA
jgi:hypothetical protein